MADRHEGRAARITAPPLVSPPYYFPTCFLPAAYITTILYARTIRVLLPVLLPPPLSWTPPLPPSLHALPTSNNSQLPTHSVVQCYRTAATRSGSCLFQEGYADRLKLSAKVPQAFLVDWTLPPHHRGGVVVRRYQKGEPCPPRGTPSGEPKKTKHITNQQHRIPTYCCCTKKQETPADSYQPLEMSTVVSRKLEMSIVVTNWKRLVRTGKLDRLDFIFWEWVHCSIHYLQYNCARISYFLGNHSPALPYCGGTTVNPIVAAYRYHLLHGGWPVGA